jgi:transposase InsO family protein
MIGKSYRQSQRIVKRIAANQMLGLKHGNLGRSPANRIAQDTKDIVMRLFKEKYFDFNLLHFQEKLREVEGIEIKRETLRKWAHEQKLVKRYKRRGRVRIHKPRPRMPRRGMLIQFDGSEHEWFVGKAWCTLIGGIDDATGEIVGLEFFEGENALNCMKVFSDIIRQHGVPEALYLDQATYFGKAHRDQDQTQFGRAASNVNCRLILARSPQAKGKIERLWGTLQDRLIAELRLHGVSDFAQANAFLTKTFIPDFNKRFSTHAREAKSAFRSAEAFQLRQIFCLQQTRKISMTNLFTFNQDNYMINGNVDYRYRTAVIKEYPDGSTEYEVYGKPITVTNLGKSKVKPKLEAA